MEWSDFIKTNFKIGDKVWVCDYRFNNEYIKKPIRHVPPTKVMIDSNENTKKRVYYSDHHFKALNKKDEPTSKVIAPFDNTGFRSYTGIPVQVFYTEEEAQEYYQNRKAEIKEEAIKEKESIMKEYDDFISSLE